MTALPPDNHDAAADQATDGQATDDDELFEPGEALLSSWNPPIADGTVNHRGG